MFPVSRPRLVTVTWARLLVSGQAVLVFYHSKEGLPLRFSLVLLVAIATQALTAQTVSGVVTGRVTDPSDASVARATITLISEARAASRTGQSDETGVFTLNSVQPGIYTLTVEHPGFKQYRRTGIVLTANERLPVDPRLEIGGATEVVRVEAQGAVVQTASAERTGLVTASQLGNLTLKGRDFMGLLRLMPGVVDTNPANLQPITAFRASTSRADARAHTI